jgi:predicted MFS family arabinose efflux permease
MLAALGAVGLTTVAGQILTPLAGDLALPEQRGRVVGTVVSGLITGILLSRTISGFFAHAFGWRAIYEAAALLMVVLAIVLAQALPPERTRPVVPYGTLLRSVFAVVRRHRSVKTTLVIGACAFSVFTMFWTGLTFLLSSPPFSYSVSEIGLVGLVGLAGALAAQRAGWLHDRGWSVPGTGGALMLGLVSLVIAGFGATNIIPILIAVLLLDVAIQATNVLNQTRLFSIDPDARSRLNTAFVASNFIGGAIGSALASLLWESGGWRFVVFGATALIVLALTVWVTQRRFLTIR